MSLAFFVVGAVLIGAAVYALAGRRETLAEAWTAARGASPVLIIACVLSPVVNWLAATATIWILTGRYGNVKFGEMAALIGATWLLNLLPMRPGMVGRVAYHKKYNGIRVRDSVRLLFMALICTGVSLGVLLVMVVIAGRVSGQGGANGWNGVGAIAVLIGVPPVVLGVVAAVMRRSARGGHAWRWPAAVGFRYVDMVTWAMRYAMVFVVIGKPVGIVGAGALTAVGQVAMLTPIQLGLREWTVGMAMAMLPREGADAIEVKEWKGETKGEALVDAAAPGLLADGVMRAAELLVVAPVGSIAIWWLWRKRRRDPGGASASGPEKK